MDSKRKAAPPAQAGTLGETASKTTAGNCNKNSRFRQQIKNLIVYSCCRGLLTVGLAERLIRWGGLARD